MSANEAMLRSVLTLTALLTVPALTQASSYSHVCATPTNYQGSAEYATGVTCDQAMASFTGAGQALHNDDFSNAFESQLEKFSARLLLGCSMSPFLCAAACSSTSHASGFTPVSKTYYQ